MEWPFNSNEQVKALQEASKLKGLAFVGYKVVVSRYKDVFINVTTITPDEENVEIFFFTQYDIATIISIDI